MSEPISLRANRSPNPADFRNNADAFSIRLLTNAVDRTDALRLRHRGYLAQGYDLNSPTGEYSDAIDSQPTTALFGAYDQDRLVATMRLCFSLPQHAETTLPCAPYYPEVAALKRTSAGGLVEVSRLAIEPDLDNTSYRTTLYGFMVRSGFIAARAAEVSSILVATKSEWVGYYKHLLGFEQVGVAALYPPGDIPITLLAGRLEEASLRIGLRNRFFRITDEEIAAMRRTLGDVVAFPDRAVARSR